MIDLVGLTKHFGRMVAIDSITATVMPAMVTGFLGRNGAGKTTTIRIALGLTEPTEGRATVNGRRYQELRWPLCEVGAVLDGAYAHPARRVGAHLRALAASTDVPAARVDDVLATVGLADVGGRRAGQLSLGMTQRLNLAAALLPDPPVLILDEPFTGLDPDGTRWLRGLLRDLAAEGRTVFVSSHQLADLQQVAARVLVVDDGKLIADDTLDGFIQGRQRPRVRVCSADIDQPRLLAALHAANLAAEHQSDGSLHVIDTTSAEVGRIAQCAGIALTELTAERVDLESAFLQAAGR